MTISSLKDVYLEQLQDMWSANKQALAIVDELGRAASDKSLSQALIAGVDGISTGQEKLAEICNKHGINPDGEICKGMAGLAEEARSHGLKENFSDDDARDAMIITQYQRMVHYALAGYGCLVAFANRLGEDGDGAILQQCLDNTYDGDRRMTEIATGHVNAAAA